MARYITSFERINFGITPVLRQTADVIFETSLPFDDAHAAAFEEAAWGACYEQNPHWANPSGPACVPTGWSSVLPSRKFTLVDEEENLSVAWYIPERSWLKQDGVTCTIDVDEAGRFSQAGILALQAKYPGERYSMVMPSSVKEIYHVHEDDRDNLKLQIVYDEFVVWGYGPDREKTVLHVEKARMTLLDRFTIPFKLPEASEHLGQPTIYEQGYRWAWKFSYDGGSHWNLVDSEETARTDAREEAIKTMRSNGYHDCDQWLAVKHRVLVRKADVSQT